MSWLWNHCFQTSEDSSEYYRFFFKIHGTEPSMKQIFILAYISGMNRTILHCSYSGRIPQFRSLKYQKPRIYCSIYQTQNKKRILVDILFRKYSRLTLTFLLGNSGFESLNSFPTRNTYIYHENKIFQYKLFHGNESYWRSDVSIR